LLRLFDAEKTFCYQNDQDILLRNESAKMVVENLLNFIAY